MYAGAGCGMANIIDFDALEKVIKAYDAMLKEYGVAMDEEKLLLDVLTDRRNMRIANLRASDMVGKVPLGGLFKKIMKHQEDEPDY